MLSSIETAAHRPAGQCLRFKYFTTFLICTTCLGLLSASLTSHKWLVSKPIRVLKLNGGHQATNFTALMLTAGGAGDQPSPLEVSQSYTSALLTSLAAESTGASGSVGAQPATSGGQSLLSGQNGNKFQGEIYFGLFKGVKVLNYGFGDRVSQISGESLVSQSV